MKWINTSFCYLYFFSQDVWAYLGYFLQPKSFLYNRSKYTINNDLLTSVHDFTFLNICVNDYKGSFENNLILEKILPSYRNQSIDLLAKSIDWFLYEGNTECEIWEKMRGHIGVCRTLSNIYDGAFLHGF